MEEFSVAETHVPKLIQNPMVKAVDEGIQAFKDGHSRYSNPYRSQYTRDGEDLGYAWDNGWRQAYDKANSTEGKVLGFIDLSKRKFK